MPQNDAKIQLKKNFSKDYLKYYWVPIFDEHGYERQTCKKCGTSYWAIPGSQECPNTTCSNYTFIGKPNGKAMDYIETWKAIEKFFVDNGHVSVPSYPVIARWFPGMYFTLASIVAFQRSVHGRTVFEIPYDRVIIPQTCLRFNDIPNVGVTGRHMTNFVMIGQHSLYDKTKPNTYWKEKCTELDYDLLTKIFKIRPEDIKWVEDVWAGPNAFGYSLEYYVKGLELGNAVFTEFIGTLNDYKTMDQKVIDMGAGLERFCWYTQGTPTAYDAVYGPVIKKMKSMVDYDEKIFQKYSELAGNLNIDEAADIVDERRKIAKLLGTSYDELQKHIESLEAVYAITDHAKTLLYAITDGGLPSNVGGGYNLRVVLRRALAFIDKFNLDVDLQKVCEWHAYYLKKLTPRLTESLDEVNEIIGIEENRYKAMKEKARKIVLGLIESKEVVDDNKMTTLYESEGVTPELITEIATEQDTKINIPENFYEKISEKHMKSTDMKEKKISLDLEGLKPTELLFRKNEKELTFTAKILRVTDGWVVLDRTAFYAESGGQDHDLGKINNTPVEDVQMFGNIIAHKTAGGMKEGMTVNCVVDKERREQLTKHHTAVHLINAAARRILGSHVWQGGSGKSVEKAHLDITHHSALSEEEIDKIEELANKFVGNGLPIEKKIMARQTAEAEYGMRIYQGGAVPERELRIVVIKDKTDVIDAEACGGTHVDNTKDIGEIIITSTERIQDGLVRITIMAGNAAKNYRSMEQKLIDECMDILMCKENELLKCTKELFAKWKKIRKETKTLAEKKATTVEIKGLVNVIDANVNELRMLAKKHKGIFFGKKDKSVVVSMDGAENIMKNMPADIGVKGGGRGNFAQGRYEREPTNDAIKKIRNLIGTK